MLTYNWALLQQKDWEKSKGKSQSTKRNAENRAECGEVTLSICKSWIDVFYLPSKSDTKESLANESHEWQSMGTLWWHQCFIKLRLVPLSFLFFSCFLSLVIQNLRCNSVFFPHNLREWLCNLHKILWLSIYISSNSTEIFKWTFYVNTSSPQTKETRTQLAYNTIIFNFYTVKSLNHMIEKKKQTKYQKEGVLPT